MSFLWGPKMNLGRLPVEVCLLWDCNQPGQRDAHLACSGLFHSWALGSLLDRGRARSEGSTNPMQVGQNLLERH